MSSTNLFTPFREYRIDVPDPTDDISDRGFTGHKHNDYIKLIYMNARYYLPNTNRWLSPDSIIPDPTNPQSYNRYSYTLNNPINFTDPTGHRECGAGSDCEDPLPHTSPFQEALLIAWYYYEDNFDLPFEGQQNLTQEFGPTKWSKFHDGLDWNGDFTVQAPASGTVTKADFDAPAGMWRLRNSTTGVTREWLTLKEKDRNEEDGLLEPERLLATGEWTDDAPGWSHTRGTIIRINHGHNLETVYYHTNPSVAAGTAVNQGEALGVTANTGWSTGTHLHYTVNFTYNGVSIPINPFAPPAIIRHLLP